MRVVFRFPYIVIISLKKVTLTILKVTFSREKVVFRILKVTFSDEKVTFSGEKVTFRNEKVTFSDEKVVFLQPTKQVAKLLPKRVSATLQPVLHKNLYLIYLA